jgi:carbonic anhydrase
MRSSPGRPRSSAQPREIQRADAMTVRGFIYDVDTGKLDEVNYPGAMGSFG